MRTGVDLNPGY